MRVCPCGCGYVDPPEWRHSKYSYWIDWTEFENIPRLAPNLVGPLLKAGKAEDKYYVYRLMKHGRSVERKAKIDYGEQWKVPMEKRKEIPHDFRKYWFKSNPNQTKLDMEK